MEPTEYVLAKLSQQWDDVRVWSLCAVQPYLQNSLTEEKTNEKKKKKKICYVLSTQLLIHSGADLREIFFEICVKRDEEGAESREGPGSVTMLMLLHVSPYPGQCQNLLL